MVGGPQSDFCTLVLVFSLHTFSLSMLWSLISFLIFMRYVAVRTLVLTWVPPEFKIEANCFSSFSMYLGPKRQYTTLDSW